MIDMQVELQKLNERLRSVETAQSSIVIFSYVRPTRDEWEKAYWKKTGIKGAVPVGTRLIWYNLMTARLVTFTTANDLNNGTASSGEVYRYYTAPMKESRRIINYIRHNTTTSGSNIPYSGGSNSHADYFTDDYMLSTRVMAEQKRGLIAFEIFRSVEAAAIGGSTSIQIGFKVADRVLSAQFLLASENSERTMSADIMWKTNTGVTSGALRTASQKVTQPIPAADWLPAAGGGNILIHAFLFNPYHSFKDNEAVPYLGGWTGHLHVAPANSAYYLAGVQDMSMSHLGQEFEFVFTNNNDTTLEGDGVTVVFGYYGDES